MYVYMPHLCILCSFLAQIWSVQGVSFNKTLAETSSSWGDCSWAAADGVEVCAWPFGADVSYRYLPWCHQLERWHHILLFRQGHWVTWGVLKSHFGRTHRTDGLSLVAGEAMSQSLHRKSWASFNITRPWRLEIILGSSWIILRSAITKRPWGFPSQFFFGGCHVETNVKNHQDVLKVRPPPLWHGLWWKYLAI